MSELGIDASELGIVESELGIVTSKLGIVTSELGIVTSKLGIVTSELGTDASVPTIRCPTIRRHETARYPLPSGRRIVLRRAAAARCEDEATGLRHLQTADRDQHHQLGWQQHHRRRGDGGEAQGSGVCF